ncbi:uncharacterized protein F4812DRAFT_455837 [Daldinia caldariorum]|uniref:uncharacterized protein n=1 Tax=Daldinia caldariorum TaxID=326644 RepID=UPI0020073632|nr:uncharacterized protein F4812DRAFT_455837 [Daldinia caldariorum]KAI1471729.1 hypothetical protein F4812DRAFT_455837 [Daldinia caldariorum]
MSLHFTPFDVVTNTPFSGAARSASCPCRPTDNLSARTRSSSSRARASPRLDIFTPLAEIPFARPPPPTVGVANLPPAPRASGVCEAAGLVPFKEEQDKRRRRRRRRKRRKGGAQLVSIVNSTTTAVVARAPGPGDAREADKRRKSDTKVTLGSPAKDNLR